MKTYHRATVSDNNTILRTIGKWHKILSAAEVEVTALMVEDDSGNPPSRKMARSSPQRSNSSLRFTAHSEPVTRS